MVMFLHDFEDKKTNPAGVIWTSAWLRAILPETGRKPRFTHGKHPSGRSKNQHYKRQGAFGSRRPDVFNAPYLMATRPLAREIERLWCLRISIFSLPSGHGTSELDVNFAAVCPYTPAGLVFFAADWRISLFKATDTPLHAIQAAVKVCSAPLAVYSTAGRSALCGNTSAGCLWPTRSCASHNPRCCDVLQAW